MDFTKATNRQLIVLFRNEIGIKKQYIHDLITEYIKRGLMDGLIKHIVGKVFPSSQGEESYKDYMQEGYYYVFQKIKNYDSSKSTLSKFVYMIVKQGLLNVLEGQQAVRRQSNKDTYSLDKPVENDTETLFIDTLISNNNVEKAVIQKLYVEEILSKLTEKQKEALILFVEGYSYDEIGEIHNKHKAAIGRRIRTAIKTINPNQKYSISQLGLMNYVKE